MPAPVAEFLARWPLDLFLAANLALGLGLYLWAARRVSRRDLALPWPRSATACAVVAVALLAVVYLGPMAGWAHTFMWVHMTQHLVAMMVVAPLLVLSAPITLIFRVSSPAARRRWVVPALRSTAVRWLTNPLLTWLLFAGVLLTVHFSPFYDWALRNHDADTFLKQPLFLMAGFLYYFPLIGSNLQPKRPSHPMRLMSMAAMMVPEAIVGAVLFFASVPLYPTFATAERPFGLEPLADQHLAGATMWAFIMVMDTVWLMDMVRDWMRSEESTARRIDAEIAAERAALGAGVVMRRALTASVLGAALLLSACSMVPSLPSPRSSSATVAVTSDLGLGLTTYPAAERGAPLALSGPTLDGGSLDIASLRGKVVVLNAWASWCDPCKEELPLLAAAAKSANPADIAFLGLDVNDVAGPAQALAAQTGIAYPSIVDPKGQLLARIPGVPPTAIPSTVVLDREGRVAARIIGTVKPGMLDPVLAELTRG